MKIAVIGAGISGLSVAHLLKENHDVAIFENKAEIGGLIKCERINNCLYHKVGGHVFNSKNQDVLHWFWSFFDKEKEFVKAKRNAKVYFQSKIIGYPIENYLYELEKNQISKIINEILALSVKPKVNPFDYANFQAFLINNFGQTLYDIYFEPYNRKIWQTDLTNVAMQWLEGKLPMPDYNEIILSNILREEEKKMVHSFFYYPKYNGSQFIVDRLREGLNINSSYQIKNLGYKDDQLIINNTERFDKVIYTGDVRKLSKLMPVLFNELAINVDSIASLKSNGTSTLFCETDKTDISWLYIPESFTKAHRIIYTGNFSESNNLGSTRMTCVVEFSGYVPYNDMVAEIRKLPGNLTPLASNFEANSYVIQNIETKQIMDDLKKKLSTRGLYLLGRFAEWEYYNMDKAIEASFRLIDQMNQQ